MPSEPLPGGFYRVKGYVTTYWTTCGGQAVWQVVIIAVGAVAALCWANVRYADKADLRVYCREVPSPSGRLKIKAVVPRSTSDVEPVVASENIMTDRQHVVQQAGNQKE